MEKKGILKELTPKKIFSLLVAFIIAQVIFGSVIYSVVNTHKLSIQLNQNEKRADERYQNIMDFLKLSIGNLEKIMNEKFKKVEDDIRFLKDEMSSLKGEITKIKIAIVKKHPDLAQDLISKKDNEKQTPKEKFTGMGGSDEE